MPEQKTREKDLETIAVLAAASLVFHFVTHYPAFVYLAAGLLLLGLFSKALASRLASLWMRFAELLGTFNTRLILGLVYFLVLTPLSVIFRMFTKKHPASSKALYGPSYFTFRDHVFSKNDLEKMW